jgi:hypothetical protein
VVGNVPKRSGIEVKLSLKLYSLEVNRRNLKVSYTLAYELFDDRWRGAWKKQIKLATRCNVDEEDAKNNAEM